MKRIKLVYFISIFCLLWGVPKTLYAQVNEDMMAQTKEIETRMRELEDYVAAINANLIKFSDKIESDFDYYKKEVESGLENYSQNLNVSIDQRLRSLDDNVVELSLTSKGYRKIETNSGVFLISINKVKSIPNGYRLIFHIGNPNYAAYVGVNLTLLWGKKWDPNSKVPYETWRQSLGGGEYSYKGKLGPGTWTEIAVDVMQVTTKQLEHIECSMDVDSIQLNLKSPGLF